MKIAKGMIATTATLIERFKAGDQAASTSWWNVIRKAYQIAYESWATAKMRRKWPRTSLSESIGP